MVKRDGFEQTLLSINSSGMITRWATTAWIRWPNTYVLNAGPVSLTMNHHTDSSAPQSWQQGCHGWP